MIFLPLIIHYVILARSIAFLELQFLHFARKIRMINIMKLDTLGPRISVIETNDIFGKCFNLLGRVVLYQILKTD